MSEAITNYLRRKSASQEEIEAAGIIDAMTIQRDNYKTVAEGMQRENAALTAERDQLAAVLREYVDADADRCGARLPCYETAHDLLWRITKKEDR